MSDPTGEPRSTTKLADSPWFWFLLFGVMALAALFVVGPKFSRRQSQLQQKYENRRDAWEQRVRRESQELPGGERESLSPADTPSESP